jgi:hypothetical protein
MEARERAAAGDRDGVLAFADLVQQEIPPENGSGLRARSRVLQ